jgi:site-specific DNA recombinase
VLAWLKEALHASMKDERDYHGEAIQKLQQEYQRLQARLDALYVDKLDRKVEEGTYLRLSERWRGEQEDMRRSLERHEKANRSYVDAGIQLLELASTARTLYEQQPMLERRRLLNYTFSNCTWKDGRLTVTFRKPFDTIADTNAAYETEKAASGSADGLSERWLPELVDVDNRMLNRR